MLLKRENRGRMGKRTLMIVAVCILIAGIILITAEIFESEIASYADRAEGQFGLVKSWAGDISARGWEKIKGVPDMLKADKEQGVQANESAGISLLNNSEIGELFDLEGFSNASVELSGTNLLVKKDCTALVMPVADTQLLSIYYGLMNEGYARPLTHDLIKSMIEVFGIKIRIIKIAGMANGVYTANIVLEQDGRLLNLDARPSDAAGIAVRTNADVYVRDEFFEKYGEKVC